MIAQLGPDVFADPTALVQQQRRGAMDDDNADTMQDLLAGLNADRSFQVTPNMFENWAGLGERWFWGRGQWYFITPDGMVYEYDTNVEGIPGNLVAELSPEYFENPTLLTNRTRR